MSHSESQKRQKAEAMRESERHMNHASVTGMSEHAYLRAKQNYMEARKEGKEPNVPKEVLEREYDKTPSGGYSHKRAGTYEE